MTEKIFTIGNILTIANLTCGLAALALVIGGDLWLACWLLVLGAAFARRWITGRFRHGALLADGAALALLLATGPVLTAALAVPEVVAGWSAVAGAVTGLAFPVLLEAAAGAGRDERQSAAAIEAADHLGAAFGALVTGLIWLPVYGITATCLLFAGLKAISLLGLTTRRRAAGPAPEANTR